MNKVYLITLGCDKNKVDGETMGGLLTEAGYVLTGDAAEAEIIIVNTCGFIKAAVSESIETILKLSEYKRAGNCKHIIVAGCMAERYKDEILTEIPEADALVGVRDYGKIAEVLLSIKSGGAFGHSLSDRDETRYSKRLLLPVSHVAHVKIAEGCDNRCSYCAIPIIRGPYVSRPLENILSECEALVRLGARELVLVAQDTSLYGTDLYGRPLLHDLLYEINKIEGLGWARVMYAYPEHIYPELIDAIRVCKKICDYIDIPIQHSQDSVLRRMNRAGAGESLRRLILRLRDAIPGIALRTTLITGFPGETEEDFSNLLSFVEEIRFDRLGVFAFSREEGTPASVMKERVKKEVRTGRRDLIMETQQAIHMEKQRGLVGGWHTVFTDSCERDGDTRVCVGRTYRDAYETDSIVRFISKREINPGDFARVKVTGTDGYDLVGEYEPA